MSACDLDERESLTKLTKLPYFLRKTVGVEAVDGVLFGATENTLEQPETSLLLTWAVWLQRERRCKVSSLSVT